MKTKLNRILGAATVSLALIQMVSCGNSRNVTGTSSANGIGPAATLDQKVRAIQTTFPCANGAKHTLSVVRFSSVGPGAVGTRIGSSGLNETGAMQVAIGINSERSVAVVKDYGHALDVYFYLCPASNYYNGNAQYSGNIFVQSATLESPFETISLNRQCYFNQILLFRATLFIAGGVPQPYAFFPVDRLGSVPGICQSGYGGDYYGGYNGGYYGGY